MPMVNYCKKCKAEVHTGERCARCGNRLTKAGERLSGRYQRVPVSDWFCWNAILRVVVPVITIVLGTVVLAEAITEGETGVINVLTHGFLGATLCAFGALLLITLILLLLQGPEEVCCTLNAQGATLDDYVRNPSTLKLYARLTSPSVVLAHTTPAEQESGLFCVGHTALRWDEISRVKYWPETRTILLYKPRFWQAMCIRCDPNAYEETVSFVQGRLLRKKRRGKRGK
jgi:hypothetical protein